MSKTLAIVVPAHNEAEVIDAFNARLMAVLADMATDATVIYVDDGSTDATWQHLESLAEKDRRVTALRLSRNFGKEAALTAGLDHVDADAVIVIDADLQDPPEFIPSMLAKAEEGYDVVYGSRSSRAGETVAKRATSAAFYRVMNRLANVPVPRDTGDFRLMSRRAVEAVKELRERQRFMKGIFAWIGYRQIALLYDRDPRKAGETKWNYWRLTNLAVEGITSFSTAPLRMASWVGACSALVAFVYGSWIFVKALIWGDPVHGYPTLMVVILFLGGAQLLALGVIGEYIGRTYMEAKRRPLYFVEARLGGGGDVVRSSRVSLDQQQNAKRSVPEE
jgi:glycosyltransferase involved in cell wall biosynthesis